MTGVQTRVIAVQLSGWVLDVFRRQSKQELLLARIRVGRETGVKDDSKVSELSN